MNLNTIRYMLYFEKMYLKHYMCLLFLFSTLMGLAQTVEPDSTNSSILLDEVVVSGNNITRVENHLVIIPTSNQKKHANDGYGVLHNLMIPGLIVDVQSNAVEAMGMTATLYINGMQSDERDIKMLRPRDILRIEYYDAPSGKYAKDKIAINFIIKQYKSGGYVQLDALQTIGFTHGDYNMAGSISKGNTTFSVFGGSDYFKAYDEVSGTETYDLPSESLTRTINSRSESKKHNEYVQLRMQNTNGSRYFVSKLSLVNTEMPHLNEKGTYYVNESVSDFSSRIKQGTLMPKLDFNCDLPLTGKDYLSLGIHGKYSRNSYTRHYCEEPFYSTMEESENAYEFQLSGIYEHYGKSNNFSAELYQYYNLWDAEYTGNNFSKQYLWQSESQAFFSYNHSFTKGFSIRSRIGIDWLQYRLRGTEKFSQISPRLNLNLQYQKNATMFLWSFNYVNSYHGINIINNAVLDLNQYMYESGNPDLKKSNDINTYVYYTSRFKNVGLTAMCQYHLEHNPVMVDYRKENDKILKTYSNSGNIHYYSFIAAATYELNKNIAFSGDIRFNHTDVNAKYSHSFNDVSGNISMNVFAGNFAITPFLNLRQNILNRISMVKDRVPVSFGTSCSYRLGNLFIEVSLQSPFSCRKIQRVLHQSYYSFEKNYNSKTEYNYCNIKLSYVLEWGRKTKKISKDIDKNINSSLLRVTQ